MRYYPFFITFKQKMDNAIKKFLFLEQSIYLYVSDENFCVFLIYTRDYTMLKNILYYLCIKVNSRLYFKSSQRDTVFVYYSFSSNLVFIKIG